MEVAVEKALGPMHGYYHSVEKGTWLDEQRMSREEAEELGYSPCGSCFDTFEEES